MSVKFYSEIVSPFVQTKVFFHYKKLRELQHKKIVMPVTCEIDLTDGFCNNKCKHCFFGTDLKSTPVLIDTKEVKKVIKELYDNGVKAVEFTGGGEPTTHPNICDILAYAIDLGLDVGLITNGLLLDKIETLVSKLKFIRISLDAASDHVYRKVHGVDCFETIIDNIRKIESAVRREKIGIGFLIVPENVCDITDATALANELGVRFIQYRPASLPYETSDSVWLEAEAKVKNAITLNKPEKLQIFDAGVKWKHLNNCRKYSQCHTNTLVAVIKANGDIPLCVLKRNEEDKIVGNIYNGGFVGNWFSERHLKLIDNINLNKCRKPCKHDSYNIVCEALISDLYHKNFI